MPRSIRRRRNDWRRCWRAAAYAAGGYAALAAQADKGDKSARLLIEQMGGKRG